MCASTTAVDSWRSAAASQVRWCAAQKLTRRSGGGVVAFAPLMSCGARYVRCAAPDDASDGLPQKRQNVRLTSGGRSASPGRTSVVSQCMQHGSAPKKEPGCQRTTTPHSEQMLHQRPCTRTTRPRSGVTAIGCLPQLTGVHRCCWHTRASRRKRAAAACGSGCSSSSSTAPWSCVAKPRSARSISASRSAALRTEAEARLAQKYCGAPSAAGW